MAYHSGVTVGKKYKYGYVCEYCGKTVESTSEISTFVLGASYGKATTTATVSRADYNMMVSAGKARLAALCDTLDEQTVLDPTGGDIKVNGETVGQNRGLYGECPFCKKRQHWSWDFKNMKNFSVTNYFKIVRNIALTLGVIAFIIGTIVGYNVETDREPFVFGLYAAIPVMVLAFLGIYLFVFRDQKKLAREKEELKHLQKTYPAFLGWTEDWDRPERLTVH